MPPPRNAASMQRTHQPVLHELQQPLHAKLMTTSAPEWASAAPPRAADASFVDRSAYKVHEGLLFIDRLIELIYCFI